MFIFKALGIKKLSSCYPQMIGMVTDMADVERREGLLRIGEVGKDFVCFSMLQDLRG